MIRNFIISNFLISMISYLYDLLDTIGQNLRICLTPQDGDMLTSLYVSFRYTCDLR